jgi:hypothetical protein
MAERALSLNQNLLHSLVLVDANSIYFIEKVHKLFEIDFVVRFDARDFYHSVDLVIGDLLPQDLKDILQVLATYIALPKMVVNNQAVTYFCRSNIEKARMR